MYILENIIKNNRKIRGGFTCENYYKRIGFTEKGSYYSLKNIRKKI